MLRYFFTSLLFSLLGVVGLLEAQEILPISPNEVKSLAVGDRAPLNVEVSDVNGRQRTLLSILNDKPGVIIFYRGGW